MTKPKFVLIIAIYAIVAYVFAIVFLDRALSEEYFMSSDLNGRDSPQATVVAFVTALRLNNEIVYEVTDPLLWPRLDNWMKTHEVQNCKWRGLDGEYILLGDADSGYDVMYMCSYIFDVSDISIQEGRIVDWGTVVEK